MRWLKAGSLLACVAMTLAGLSGAGVEPAAATAPEATSTPCGSLVAIVLDGVTECTHGGDAAPPALPDATLRSRSIPSAPCPGDGRSGSRVHVLLGVPADTTASDPPATKSLLRQALYLADANLDAASPSMGQHYRFFCRHDRNVTIRTVQLPAIGSDSLYGFDDVTTGLTTQGFTKRSAIYATFVENIDCCYSYGGQGSMTTDDRSNPSTNSNNGPFPRYSMIRLGATFDATMLALVFQHETGHNMGAVQNSAPHTSGAFHCYETNDIMCYNDGGPYFSTGGTLVSVCPDLSSAGMYVFDCGGDDYYNASPASSTYLADHWNVADSRWLTPVGASGK
jgi:hypothetical protein